MLVKHILSPECSGHSELVECGTCVTSELKIPYISLFSTWYSQNSLTSPPRPSTRLPHATSHVTLRFSPTEISKSLKASNFLLPLDVQNALSSPWNSFLPSIPTFHIPLLVTSCSSLAPCFTTSLESFPESPMLVHTHVCSRSISYSPYSPKLLGRFTFWTVNSLRTNVTPVLFID